MKIEIGPLLEHPEQTKTVKGRREATHFPLDSETFRIDDPLDIEFTLANEAGVIVASGNYHGTITSICGRCLKDYEKELHGDFQARFFTTAEELRQEKQEEDDPVYREPIEAGEVDLGFVICQDILVQCPMRPLCREDCEGLCPECGADLNEEDCGHEPEKQDPRLSRFRELAEEMDNTE